MVGGSQMESARWIGKTGVKSTTAIFPEGPDEIGKLTGWRYAVNIQTAATVPCSVGKPGVNSTIAIFPIWAGEVCITRPSAYA
jgi:hypothetical protein